MNDILNILSLSVILCFIVFFFGATIADNIASAISGKAEYERAKNGETTREFAKLREENQILRSLIKVSGYEGIWSPGSPLIDEYITALETKRGDKAKSGDITVKNVYLDTAPQRICADIYSKKSGRTYKTSLTDCSCKDYAVNSKKTQNYVCKHMLAFSLSMNILPFDYK